MRTAVNLIASFFLVQGATASAQTAPDALTATTYEAGGARIEGQVGAHALVRVRPGVDAARWAASRALDVPRVVYPRLGIWRVRDASGDGAALRTASRATAPSST